MKIRIRVEVHQENWLRLRDFSLYCISSNGFRNNLYFCKFNQVQTNNEKESTQKIRTFDV